jgi:calcineurin-like phosphoesterase family protein
MDFVEVRILAEDRVQVRCASRIHLDGAVLVPGRVCSPGCTQAAKRGVEFCENSATGEGGDGERRIRFSSDRHAHGRAGDRGWRHVNLDVIGDVHGQFEKLVSLLSRLGYTQAQGIWRHPTRTAIFVGDLIDRGPKQLATVELVRAMVEAGAAQCLLGNHEYNAIGWTMPDPMRPGRFIRDHDAPGNRALHQGFLDEIGEGSGRHRAIIAWFMSLPLWLDFGALRVVHACWHQASMEALMPMLGPNRSMTEELVRMSGRDGHWVHEALGMLCKGPEIGSNDSTMLQENYGELPREIRLRWWRADEFPSTQGRLGTYSGPPVIFGHYWFEGEPAVISPRFACLDYSVARDGPLVAYRWDGEPELSSGKIVWE